jgi:hypothetical protein
LGLVLAPWIGLLGALAFAEEGDEVFAPTLRQFEGALEPGTARSDLPDGPSARPGWPQTSTTDRDWWDRLGGLARGRVQIEGGYVYTFDRVSGARVSEHALPDLLLRVGLTERLEIRIGWPGWVWTRIEGEGTSEETLDPNVGLMLDLWEQQGWRPQTAILAAVPVTLEGDPFALDSLQPLAELLYLWHLGERWTIGGTTALALFDLEGDRFVQLEQTASADYLLAPRLSTFIEWTMLADHGSADDGAEHMLGAGVSWLVTERIQASWRAAAGLNDRAPQFLTGIRCAVRF